MYMYVNCILTHTCAWVILKMLFCWIFLSMHKHSANSKKLKHKCFTGFSVNYLCISRQRIVEYGLLISSNIFTWPESNTMSKYQRNWQSLDSLRSVCALTAWAILKFMHSVMFRKGLTSVQEIEFLPQNKANTADPFSPWVSRKYCTRLGPRKWHHCCRQGCHEIFITKF